MVHLLSDEVCGVGTVFCSCPGSWALASSSSMAVYREWLKLEGTSEGHLVQPPLSKQGHLQAVAKDHEFKYLQDGDSTISGQPVPAFSHSHSEKMFPDVQVDSASCVSVCAHCLLSWAPLDKRQALFSLPFCLYLQVLERSTMSLLFSRMKIQSQLSQPFFIDEVLQTLRQLARLSLFSPFSPVWALVLISGCLSAGFC